jgi:predicted nuclease of restriction endonuclease-like RecB superfamily
MNILFLLTTPHILLLALCAALVLAIGLFYVSTYILSKLLKKESKSSIHRWSLSASLLATPQIVGLLIFLFIQTKTPSDQESEKRYYHRLEKEIAEHALIGKTKEQVVELFGDGDTTKTTLIYDFSLPQADQKYILVITFKGNQVLTYYTRKG